MLTTTTNAMSKKPPLLIAQDTQNKLGVAFSYLERKKQTSNTIIAQSYHRDTAPESYQVRPESLETFKPSYASSKVKNENEDS